MLKAAFNLIAVGLFAAAAASVVGGAVASQIDSIFSGVVAALQGAVA